MNRRDFLKIVGITTATSTAALYGCGSKEGSSEGSKVLGPIYNPQNEMFRLLGTKRSFSQNETFFFSHPYPALFRLISHF